MAPFVRSAVGTPVLTLSPRASPGGGVEPPSERGSPRTLDEASQGRAGPAGTGVTWDAPEGHLLVVCRSRLGLWRNTGQTFQGTGSPSLLQSVS